nr:MAG TPA: hypothetical protein [Caudoviricetes sp.]
MAEGRSVVEWFGISELLGGALFVCGGSEKT